MEDYRTTSFCCPLLTSYHRRLHLNHQTLTCPRRSRQGAPSDRSVFGGNNTSNTTRYEGQPFGKEGIKQIGEKAGNEQEERALMVISALDSRHNFPFGS